MHVNGLVEINSNLPDLETIQTAMRLGVRPQAVNVQCTGGAYFIRNQRRRIVAVFKPRDEEPYVVFEREAREFLFILSLSHIDRNPCSKCTLEYTLEYTLKYYEN